MTATLFGKPRRDVIKDALIITVLFLVLYHFLGLNLFNPLIFSEAIIRGIIIAVFGAYFAKKKSEVTIKPTARGYLKAVLIGILLLPTLFLLVVAIAYVLIQLKPYV
ncbi:MAG: hypothetical protein WAX07_07490 [Candidatus Altiarchaeia archaeon]